MSTFSEIHEFTRRNPSYLSQKQLERDSKIIKQIIVAGDVEEDYDKVVDIFFKKYHLLSNPRYWEVMRTVWIMGGDHTNVDKFKQLMKSSRPAKSWFMTLEDADALEKLDFPILLYRAYDERYEDHGISWTSNLEWAENRAKIRKLVIKKRLFYREEIFAYISRRGEDEFIIL